MNFETSLVYLEQVPKIIVDSGFDWATFWSFSATVAIFVLGTYMAIRNFNKTIISQEKVARISSEFQKSLLSSQEVATHQNFELQKEMMANQSAAALQAFEVQKEAIASQERVAAQASLKASRQNWINDLRDTTAEFISAALNVNRLNAYKESTLSYLSINNSADSEFDKFSARWASLHVQSMKELVALRSKIELLLNPEEVDSKGFIRVVNALFKNCDQAGGPAKELSGQVVWWCQHILKQEWEKAKAGK